MRVVIVANGMMDDPGAEFDRWVRDDDPVIAADGGTNHLLKCGRYPRYIIGDLDSISPQTRTDLQAHGVVFHTYPAHKDETDLEIAMMWAASHFPTAQMVILGAMGGRPDQALANLLLLGLPEMKGQDMVIADKNWTVRVIHGGHTREFAGSVGDTLSMIPLGGRADGVCTNGLAYPLRDETLHFGPARGVSNVFERETVSISVESGMVWVFQGQSASWNNA